MSILKEIPLKDIQTNIYQPRTTFDQQELQQLANSIQQNGLIQPITVRESEKGYQIIAGERRFRAYQLLNRNTISAVVIKADQLQSAQMALIENLQRVGLNPIEQANSFKEIMRLTDCTQEQLAQKIGLSQSSIANKLRLLNLSVPVIQALEEQTITERHGRALLSLDKEKQIKALNAITTKNLNVEQSEQYINKLTQPKKLKKKNKCYGLDQRVIINSFKQTFSQVKSFNKNVDFSQNENDDNIIITITIKK